MVDSVAEDGSVVTATCLRCDQVPPLNDPGALSRTDNQTMVCAQCGTEEALEGFFKDRLTQQSDWPIKRSINIIGRDEL